MTDNPTNTVPGIRGECPTGAFRLDVRTRSCVWSREIYSILGYRPGQVDPDPELILAHKHPDDRPRAQALVAKVSTRGGRATYFHRMLDTHGREHRVLTVAEGLRDPAGQVYAVTGVLIDLTDPIRDELHRTAREAVHNSAAGRAAIEQAKGYLMCLFGVDADAAFDLLKAGSMKSHRKLADLAADLADAANTADHVRAAHLAEALRAAPTPARNRAGSSQ